MECLEYENEKKGVGSVRIWDKGEMEWITAEGRTMRMNLWGEKMRGTYQIVEIEERKGIMYKLPVIIRKPLWVRADTLVVVK